MEKYNENNIKYLAAKNRVKDLKRFYSQLLIFCILFLIFNGNLFFSDQHFGLRFNDVSIVFWIWGIVLIVKAVQLFIFNQDWEQKQLEKELKN